MISEIPQGLIPLIFAPIGALLMMATIMLTERYIGERYIIHVGVALLSVLLLLLCVVGWIDYHAQ